MLAALARRGNESGRLGGGRVDLAGDYLYAPWLEGALRSGEEAAVRVDAVLGRAGTAGRPSLRSSREGGPRVPQPERFKVLIAGGGIAGLETVMALSDLGGDQPELTLVAPEPDFVYNCALDRHASAQETAAPRISRNLALGCSNTARLPAME